MISKPLLKNIIKTNRKSWINMTIILTVLLLAFLASASAFKGAGTIMISQFFTMFAVLLPLIYFAGASNRLIAAQVDSGALAYTMSNPIKRNTVTITSAVFIISSIIAMFLVITIVGIILVLAMNIMTVGDLLLLCLGALCLCLALSSICFFASCFFNTSRHSLAVGAGIPVAFFIFRFLSSMFSDIPGMDDNAIAKVMGAFRYLTLNTLFDANGVMAHSVNMAWQFPFLIVIACIGYAAGVTVFKKKDLPL